MSVPRITIVEDESIVAEDIRLHLEQLGYEVLAIASSGEEAIAKMDERPPDLIVMDIRLGGEVDGVETAEEIHRRYDIPVVFLTACVDDETVERAKRSHPFGYLIKPFKERELRTTIEMALYRHNMEMQLKQLQRELQDKVEKLERQECSRQQREVLRLAQFRVRESVWMMRRTDDIEQVVKVLRDCLMELGIDGDGFGLNLVRGEVDSSTIEFHSLNDRGEWVETVAENGENLVLRIWRSGQPLYRRDLRAEDHYGESKYMGKQFGSVRSVLDVPFSHGTLAINHRRPDAFSQEDIQTVQLLADVLSEGFRRLEDLQALEQKEEQLRQAQKMEAIGLLAGGVAHDFNNLITIISGYCQLLLKDMESESLVQQNVREILHASERAGAMVRHLLAFSRKQVLKPEVLDLNRVVGDMGKMLKRMIGEDVELEVVPGAELEKVRVDPGQLEQVLLNLVVNAREAMLDGGRLTVETANVEIGQVYADRHGEVRPGHYAMLAVSDTGVGMDEETKARIFEPFFTTKGKERGTGLGLSTVYGIVQQSGGFIWVYSEPGVGTTFKVYLPTIAEESPVEAEAPGEELFCGSESVLVAEDDDALRELVERILREYGHEVLTAQNGVEALDLYERFGDEVDLLLTDMVMPGMKGEELVERLLARRTDLKVLYMSGYGDRGIKDLCEDKGRIRFIAKPFTPEELMRAVRGVLDREEMVVR